MTPQLAQMFEGLSIEEQELALELIEAAERQRALAPLPPGPNQTYLHSQRCQAIWLVYAKRAIEQEPHLLNGGLRRLAERVLELTPAINQTTGEPYTAETIYKTISRRRSEVFGRLWVSRQDQADLLNAPNESGTKENSHATTTTKNAGAIAEHRERARAL